MNKYILLLVLSLITLSVNAQFWKKEVTIRINDPAAYEIRQNYKYPSREIHDSIKKIILEEKMNLKVEVEEVNRQYELALITLEEAEKQKKEIAEKHALNIETRIGFEDTKMQEHLQNYANKQIATISVDSVYVDVGYKGNTKKVAFTPESLEQSKQWTERMNNMTFQQFVVAFGFNNVIDNNISSLEDSDYYFLKSNFFELGYTFKKRLSKGYTPLHFKYGASFLFNNLVATDNRYQVKSGDQTELVIHPKSLKKSRLKYVQLIFPMHLEFDFSKPRKIDDVDYYTRSESFRFGIGGYGGFRVFSRQTLKYEEDDLKIKEKTTDHYNLNNFTYGLSSYVGYKSLSLYGKYDLSTLFKNSTTSAVSLGIRIEI